MTLRRHLAALLSTGLLVAMAVIVPASTSAAATFQVPGSVDATGATDVTVALQAFLNSVPDGSTVLFPAGAQYRIDGSLGLVSRNNLTIDGQGATTFASTEGDRTRSQWKVYLGTNLTVRNLTVRGANPAGGTGESAYNAALEAQHGMEFAGVNGLDLDHVTITDVYGDFLYIGAFIGSTNTWSTNVKIHDSRFERNGRQGIAFTAVRNVEIYNNYIGNTRRATLDFEPNGTGWGVENVSFHNNTVGPGRLNFVSSVGNGPINNVSVTNNSFVGRAMQMTWWAPAYARRSGLIITGNTADVGFGNPGGAAIGIVAWDGVTVKNNVQYLQSGRDMAMVDVWESCVVDISGNTWTGGAYESRVRDFACPLGSPTALAPGTPTPPPTPPPAVTPAATPTVTATPKPAVTPKPTTTPKPGGQKPPKPRLSTTVKTFDVREPATKGRWLTMSGRVLSYQPGLGWAGLAGERVLVQFKAKDAASYRTLGSVVTRWNGTVKVTRLVRARQNGTWRLVLPQSTLLKRSAAKPDFVAVN
jgi:hypothetical protein